MERVRSLRPSLAVARYHLMAGLRNAYPVFGAAAFLLFMVLPAQSTLIVPDAMRDDQPLALLYAAAHVVGVVLVMHLLVIITATLSVAAPRGTFTDLMETAPISPANRFLGDMLGSAACALAIHLCLLPIIAFVVMISPVSGRVFFWYEMLVVAFILLGAGAASWKRRMDGPAGRARVVGNIALFATIVLMIMAVTTRWPRFRDAAGSFVAEPAPLRWAQVTREINRPGALVALLIVVYAAFLTFYALRSVQLQKRREEGAQ